MTARIAARHGSFNRICQVAAICTANLSRDFLSPHPDQQHVEATSRMVAINKLPVCSTFCWCKRALRLTHVNIPNGVSIGSAVFTAQRCASAVHAIVMYLSVCLSVCPPQVAYRHRNAQLNNASRLPRTLVFWWGARVG